MLLHCCTRAERGVISEKFARLLDGSNDRAEREKRGEGE